MAWQQSETGAQESKIHHQESAVLPNFSIFVMIYSFVNCTSSAFLIADTGKERQTSKSLFFSVAHDLH